MIIRLLLPLFIFMTASLAHAQDDPSLTRLYDTGKPSAQLYTSQQLEKPAGWALVPEDNTTHTFTGDAVFMNDKLAVALRKQSSGVEVHFKTTAGFMICAGLAHMNDKGMDPLTGFKIAENGAGAVMMETTYKSGAKLGVRMTTGEGTLEIQPGQGAVALAFDSPTSYLVVPDFFGDDLVFGEKAFTGRALPAENMCLNLLHGGNAMMMCVWESSKQQAWLLAAADYVATMRIDCLPEKKIWLAFMTGDKLWSAEKTDFKLPFPARWRNDEIAENGAARSKDSDANAHAASEKPRVIYALDRKPDTPLTAVLPTDVMRNTLGVGPCQYILAVEGMKADGDPTPNNVMEWVEKQFEQKKEKKSADDIKERLDFMTKHIAEANARIKAYDDFAAAVKTKLAGAPKGSDCASIAANLGAYAKAGLAASPEQANQLAAQVIALIGKENAADQCKKLGAQLREIGATQDHSMARCRMALRRLKQEGRTLNGPKPTGAIAEVQAMAEKFQ